MLTYMTCIYLEKNTHSVIMLKAGRGVKFLLNFENTFS